MIIMDSCIHEDQGTEKTVLTIQGRVLKVCNLSNIQSQYQLITIIFIDSKGLH
mgnify:CR=1 FL=1